MSFHSTHTPESPCARCGLQVSEPLSFSHTLFCAARVGNQLAAFPRPLPSGSELGSAKERPWCDIKRQEEGQSLAHPRSGSGPGRCCCCEWQLAPAPTTASCAAPDHRSHFLLGALGNSHVLGLLFQTSDSSSFPRSRSLDSRSPPWAPPALHTLL